MACESVFASSPVLALNPQAIHKGPLDKSGISCPNVSLNQSAIWSQFAADNPQLAPRGRKRSRDEAAINLDPPAKLTPVASSKPELVSQTGHGAELISQRPAHILETSAQSGTWPALSTAQGPRGDAQHDDAGERHVLRSHKSTRLDAASLQQHDTSTRSSPGRDRADSPSSIPSMANDGSRQPVVDDFTHHLGIGWSRISEDEHIQAAARGWAKYIENHYPVTNARIQLESRGLQSYLVEASEGFFLFAENLRQGRLVSQNAERAIQNLQTSPPVFDGATPLDATDSPKPAHATPVASSTKPALVDVQMDMS